MTLPDEPQLFVKYKYGSISSQDDGGPTTPAPPERGSNWIGAAFNLTSSILGAGCIGIGGAIANSGGLISFLAISVFAILSKFSFDLVVDLASEAQDSAGASTYEGLGFATYGNRGRLAVVLSKGLYSFGCLIAYIVIIRDNASGAISRLFHIHGDDSALNSWCLRIAESQELMSILLCTVFMLPLCMLRDLSPLERFSIFKVSVLLLIVGIVVYLYRESQYVEQKANDDSSSDLLANWVNIYPGIFQSLGTFVFSFAANHSIHLVFQSIKPSQQKYFSRTTSLGTLLSTVITMSIGFFVYMTFWDQTTSAMLSLYPPSTWVDLCRALLCISMLLTYPFPFLTVRELLVISLASVDFIPSQALSTDNDRQLKQPYHICLTVAIWLLTLVLALMASTLGSVLDLVGCATGTAISYVLPSIFAYKIRGPTLLGTLLMILGGSVGLIGTYYSLMAL